MDGIKMDRIKNLTIIISILIFFLIGFGCINNQMFKSESGFFIDKQSKYFIPLRELEIEKSKLEVCNREGIAYSDWFASMIPPNRSPYATYVLDLQNISSFETSYVLWYILTGGKPSDNVLICYKETGEELSPWYWARLPHAWILFKLPECGRWFAIETIVDHPSGLRYLGTMLYWKTYPQYYKEIDVVFKDGREFQEFIKERYGKEIQVLNMTKIWHKHI